jgi:hypothetical protein
MKLILMALFITLPFFLQAQNQGKYKIKIDSKEYDTDKDTDIIDDFPERLNKFMIKKEKKGDESGTYTVQIGEEERTFQPDGEYHEVEFSHDIKDLGINILDEKRDRSAKPFRLKKRK